MKLDRTFWTGFGIVGLAIIVYIPAMQAGYVWDDDVFLHNNPLIKAADGLYRFWFTTQPPDYFPLTSSMLWIEWRLWGDNPAGYHVVNILLHAGSCLLLWRVLRQLAIPGAWLAALIFALHPVNVESVAWITQRKNTLPMLFYLASLLLYLKYDRAPAESAIRKPFYAAALGTFLLGLLAKTSVVVLPVVLLLCVWWRRDKITRADIRPTVPFFALALILGLVTVWYQTYSAIGEDVVREDGMLSRLLIAGRAVWFYLYKAFLPFELIFSYPRWRADLGSPLAYVPLLALVAVFAALWRFRRHRVGKPLLFALAYFVVGLLPVLGFVDIYYMRYSLVADHWQYLSLIAVAALLGAGLTVGLRRVNLEKARVPAAAVLLVALGALTWRQQADYRDAETLWRNTIAKNPTSRLAHYNLAQLLDERGEEARAEHHFEQAVRAAPEEADVAVGMGLMLIDAGRLRDAAEVFGKVVADHPDNAVAHKSLGVALEGLGRLDDAAAHLEQAARLRPGYEEALNNLAAVRLAQGRAEAAVEPLVRAIKLRPDYAEARANLGAALRAIGRPEPALEHLRKALELNPDLEGLHFSLAMTFHDLNRLEKAVQHYARAVESPRTRGLHLNYAFALKDLGRLREAVPHYRRAIEADADNFAPRLDLADTLGRLGRFGEADETYAAAIEVAPDNVYVVNSYGWFLATCPDRVVRDGERAVELGRKAVAMTRGRDVTTMNTLAAAYAETGNFIEAARWQAIATRNAPPKLEPVFNQRLELYKDGRRYRQGMGDGAAPPPEEGAQPPGAGTGADPEASADTGGGP